MHTCVPSIALSGPRVGSDLWAIPHLLTPSAAASMSWSPRSDEFLTWAVEVNVRTALRQLRKVCSIWAEFSLKTSRLSICGWRGRWVSGGMSSQVPVVVHVPRVRTILPEFKKKCHNYVVKLHRLQGEKIAINLQLITSLLDILWN